MCGIVGIYSRKGPVPHADRWETLINLLAHRGPDEGAWWADGPFFLGHRRLSIIALDSGSQPMATANGDLVVSFNGEIYNYIELRDELRARGHVFATTSDTEVLLHGYREWGDDLPAHLTGMFAFAIADRRRQELFLARDRFGEKPLFVAALPDYVAFASEIKSLTALPDLPRDLNIDALGAYLSLNYTPGTMTLLQSVTRLAPAQSLRITQTEMHHRTYWTPTPPAATNVPRRMNEALEIWRDHFDRAVRLCLRSDVPVGIFLSGGMDSALVAESAARQGNLSTAFFIDFEEAGFSERDAAERVARQLDLPLQTTTLVPQDLNHFLTIVHHADDPMADSSALPVWKVSQMAAQSHKVVLGGDGGDELFGGYLTYRATQLHRQWMSYQPMALRSFYAGLARHLITTEGKVSFSFKLRRFLRAANLPPSEAHLTWNGTWLPAEAANLIRPGAARERVGTALPEHVRAWGAEKKDATLRSLQAVDLANYLPNDILTKMDRMSMAHSLETRAPFL
ncbi:MAG: asparagine synthase (glutamine-hydrolyzing), partial [Verrucomicrobia bacterium]|nr:asparagine synthase (glutamine-hydrolyzing) [Verrucomicrobiota bacterium]